MNQTPESSEDVSHGGQPTSSPAVRESALDRIDCNNNNSTVLEFPSPSRYEQLAGPILGGMGMVWKARDKLTNRIVAIKRIRSDRMTERAVQRFRKEAIAQAAVTHDRLVGLHHVDEDECGLYLIAQWVDGIDMQKRMQPPWKHSLNIDWILRVLTHVAEGIDALHRANLVHRDIKPANIIVNDAGLAWLTDFGLAFEMVRENQLSESATAAAGTPKYMSPEQLRGDPDVDHRTDLYSFGVTAEQLLMPFSTDLESHRLSAVMRRARHEDRTKRFQNAAEFVEELIRLRKQTGVPDLPVLSLPFTRSEVAFAQLAWKNHLLLGFRDQITIGAVEFVLIPPGQFVMGSADRSRQAEEQRFIVFPKPILVSKYTIAVELWKVVSRGRTPPALPEGGVLVTAQQALSFCGLFSESVSETGLRFSLLCESNWEFVCRGGTDAEYWWGGNQSPTVCSHPFSVDGIGTCGPELCMNSRKENAGHALYVTRGGCWTSGVREHCRSAHRREVRHTGTERFQFRIMAEIQQQWSGPV